MKKSKFLLGTLVLATALMGTGYAAWTDVLGVYGTVKTGQFNVEFIDDDEQKLTAGIKGQQDLLEINAEHDGQVASIELTNLYPGAIVQTRFEIKNTGTVAAKIDTVAFNELYSDVTDEMKEHLEVRVNLHDADRNTIASSDKDGKMYVSLSELDDSFTIYESADKELSIGDINTLVIEIKLSEDVDHNELENASAKLQFVTDWSQFNIQE